MREELDEIAEELVSLLDIQMEASINLREKHAEFREKYEELAEISDSLAHEVFDDWEGLLESISDAVF